MQSKQLKRGEITSQVFDLMFFENCIYAVMYGMSNMTKFYKSTTQLSSVKLKKHLFCKKSELIKVCFVQNLAPHHDVLLGDVAKLSGASKVENDSCQMRCRAH